VPALVRRLVEAADNQTPSVTHWGSGRPTREFLHVADAARAIRLAADPTRPVDPRPINLGTGVETPIASLVETVSRAAGYTGAHHFDISKPDGQPRRWLDVRRAREVLGFEAQVPLDAGVAETVAWFRAHRPAR
jgi:GDP-L-fucose synthase